MKSTKNSHSERFFMIQRGISYVYFILRRPTDHRGFLHAFRWKAAEDEPLGKVGFHDDLGSISSKSTWNLLIQNETVRRLSPVLRLGISSSRRTITWSTRVPLIPSLKILICRTSWDWRRFRQNPIRLFYDSALSQAFSRGGSSQSQRAYLHHRMARSAAKGWPQWSVGQSSESTWRQCRGAICPKHQKG